MNKTEKIEEAKVQLDNRLHNTPLRSPIVKNTQKRVNEIIGQMHRGKHINDITRKWLSQTLDPPRTPIFHKLSKIHKLIPVGNHIISGCYGPTEKISSFVEILL